MRTVQEIADTGVDNIKLELKEKNKGRNKYIKRIKNRQKLKKNRG